jgi:hypothetical protein
MGRARHPKPYKDGRGQVTIPWKRRVLAKLQKNEDDKKSPANPEQLRNAVGAKKGSMNALLDLGRVPQQLTSVYVSEICEALEILPPLLEQDQDDEEFIRDVMLLRKLTRDERRDVLATAKRIAEGR